MPPRLVFVGFDSMDREVAEGLIADGRMPTLARLVADGWSADVVNPRALTSSTVWSTAVTGVGPHRHGVWSWRQLQPGSYRMERAMRRPVRHPTIWQQLSDAGLRTLVIDVPTLDVDEGLDGMAVTGWSDHDREGDLASWPPELADRLKAEREHLPVDPCDGSPHDPSIDLPAILAASVEQKVDITRRLEAEVQPDVLAVVFGEAHCGGHHLWQTHDATHPRHDPTDDLDALGAVYDRLDDGLAAVLEHVGDDAVVAVLLSHGVGREKTVVHLLDEVLQRIDASMGRPPFAHRAAELLRRAPNRVARQVLRLLGRPTEHLPHLADGSRRFFRVSLVPPVGAIRLNVIGREPHGRVADDEVDEVIERLESELAQLVDLEDGHPVLQQVVRTEDLYPGGPARGMPDLLVEWDCPNPVVGVRSPTIGTVRGAYAADRTGGHKPDGRLVVSGPSVLAGRGAPMPAVDLAPTLAALVDVELVDVDGAPVPLRM